MWFFYLRINSGFYATIERKILITTSHQIKSSSHQVWAVGLRLTIKIQRHLIVGVLTDVDILS